MALPESLKATALAALTANGGNVSKTAREIGVNRSTLKDWAKGIKLAGALELVPAAEGALGDICERLARIYLTQAQNPEVVKATSGPAAMTSAAIAIDKMRLLRGEEAQNTPTAIQFNVVQNILIQAGAIER
jgi:transposase-like protein